MATLTASSQFGAGTTTQVSKQSFPKVGAWNQSMTHNGLRSLNMVDKLQIKTSTKTAVAKKAEKQKAKKTSSRKIVCSHGMNIVLIATEVGPWSKTGGLGDVLGGLPPALAVS